jgi:hypothetical protein
MKGMPLDQNSIQALKNMIEQVDLLISTTDPLPENRTPRCRELLRAAWALVNDLLHQSGTNSAVISHKKK